MLRRVQLLELLWRQPAPGLPVSTIASLWINPHRYMRCSAICFRSGKDKLTSGSGVQVDCREMCERELGSTLRPPCGDKGKDPLSARAQGLQGAQCPQGPKAPQRQQRPQPCPKRRPPPPPPTTCHKSNTGRWCVLALLAALAGLGGMYFLGMLDPLLGTMGLACLRTNPGEFPGLGKPRKRKARHRHPASSEDLPECVGYLIVGGGSAAISAARTIRAFDKKAKVLIMAAENAFPYQRSPLSKELWQGGAGACFVANDGTLRSVFYEPDHFYVDCKTMAKGSRGIAVARGWEVERLKLNEHKAVLEDGNSIYYETCLLATGSTPYQLWALQGARKELNDKVMMFHDVCDFETLRTALRLGARDIVIVGSTAEACELSIALTRHGRDMNIPGLRVTLVYPDETPHARVLPPYLGRWLARRLEHEGVRIVPNAKVRGASVKDGHAEVRLSTGDQLPACRVVVMAESLPDLDFAYRSGIPIDCKRIGFRANSRLYLKNDVWAAGDCVSFCSINGRTRWEGLDHALASGRLAGQNMVAANKGDEGPPAQNYSYMPMRWASLGAGASYEAVGEVDTGLTTVGVFAPVSESRQRVEPPRAHACTRDDDDDGHVDYSRGVVFYLRERVVVGMLLWNLSRRVPVARSIVERHVRYEELDDAVKQLSLH